MICLEKIYVLRSAERHFAAARSEIGDRRSGVGDNLNRLKADLVSISNSRTDGEIAVLENQKRDVEAEFVTAYGAYQTAMKLRAACETWLLQQGKVVSKAKSGPAPTRPQLALAGRAVISLKSPFDHPSADVRELGSLNDETLRQLGEQLQTVREQIATERDKRVQVKSAPPPAKDLIAQKQNEIDAALNAVCDPNQSLASLEPAVMLIAIHAGALRETVTTLIERTVGKNGVNSADKAARIAEIDANILELERQEEQICLAIEAASTHVLRREDFTPSIFFEVQDSIESATGTPLYLEVP